MSVEDRLPKLPLNRASGRHPTRRAVRQIACCSLLWVVTWFLPTGRVSAADPTNARGVLGPLNPAEQQRPVNAPEAPPTLLQLAIAKRVAREQDGAHLHVMMDGGAAARTALGDSWVESAKLTASDGGPNDSFSVVALWGDTALIGAGGADVNGNSEQGATYVFVRSDGVWTEQAKLVASDGEAGDFFGGDAVALWGDTALVGASNADGGNGAVYVFTRDGDVWSEQAKLTASDGAGADRFGNRIAISGGSMALVGASGADVNGNSGQGAAYVFALNDNGWAERAKLTASDGAAEDHFGVAVALAGDTALIGATDAVIGDNADQGAAYVFVRDGDVWSEQAKLSASDGATSDSLGSSAALSGDTALVGAIQADVGGTGDQGAAYVFTRSDGVWSEQAKLSASDGATGDWFGLAAAIFGDTALVGAPLAAVDGNPVQGAAYVFNRSDEVWSEQAKLSASDGMSGDLLGPVAVFGTTALAGALFATVDGNQAQGAAYAFVQDDGDDTPTIYVDPDSLSLSLQQDQSASRPFAIANLGDDILEWHITETEEMTGRNLEPLGTSNCVLPDWLAVAPLAGSVAGGGSQILEITLDAADLDPGGYDATLCISSNDPAQPLTTVSIGLSVTGGELTFDPLNLDFGTVPVDSTGSPQTTTLENTGIIDVTGITFDMQSGDYTADTSDCGTTLVAGQSCSVSVTFSPSDSGCAVTTLEVNSSEGAATSLGLIGVGAGDTVEEELLRPAQKMSYLRRKERGAARRKERRSR